MSSDLYRIYLSQTHRLTLVPMLQMWIDNSRKVPSAGPGKNPATSPTNPETTSGLGWMRRRHWLEQVPSGNCLSCPKHRSPGPPLKDEAHDLCLLTWNLEKWQCKCEFECECVCVCVPCSYFQGLLESCLASCSRKAGFRDLSLI